MSNPQSDVGCHNLIIQPYPIDTLANIAHIMAFFKEFYEPDNPDFAMSDESRMGFYLLLAMVQQAAEFEVVRLSDDNDATPSLFSHEPMPKESQEALGRLLKGMLDNTDVNVDGNTDDETEH